jgi:salicylate hydroxylase
VTLLGDAIHNMTPMAGVGANTALRDADLLRSKLIAATGGEVPLITALASYEEQMLDYGFAAVRQSLRNASRAAHSSHLSRAAFRTTLRLTAAVPPMRRAMARGLGH